MNEEQGLLEEKVNSAGHAKEKNLEKGREGTQEWMYTTQEDDKVNFLTKRMNTGGVPELARKGNKTGRQGR